MTPIFPLTTPPPCRRCGHPSVHDIVKPENRNGNAGRSYFRCMDGCHPQSSEFVSWDDYGGIEAGNPPCWCPDRFTSRKDKTNREPRKYFYKCPLGRCKFYAWGGEVEGNGGLGYSGGGGGDFPGSGSNAVCVKVEETKAQWTGAAGLSGHATYARPGYETQMDHDSAYGSQAASPSRHVGSQVRNRIDEIDYYATSTSEPSTHARPEFNPQMDHDSAYGSQAAGPSAQTALPASTHTTPGVSTQTDHDSAYGSQVAGPSMQAPLPTSARNRIDEIDYYATDPSESPTDAKPEIGRQSETQSHGDTESYHREDESWRGETQSYGGEAESYHGEAESWRGETQSYGGEAESYHGETESYHEETESYGGEAESYGGEAESYHGEAESYHGEHESYHEETETVPSSSPTEATRPNSVVVGAASSSVQAMPQPSQSIQRHPEVEETRVNNAVTSGAPIYTPVVVKRGEISISSMDDAFGRKFGAPRRRHCCGICAVM